MRATSMNNLLEADLRTQMSLEQLMYLWQDTFSYSRSLVYYKQKEEQQQNIVLYGGHTNCPRVTYHNIH